MNNNYEDKLNYMKIVIGEINFFIVMYEEAIKNNDDFSDTTKSQIDNMYTQIKKLKLFT